MRPALSLLISSLSSRHRLLHRLMAGLLPQTANRPVEVLIHVDDGSESSGMKRNTLAAAARGEYQCFIDDDDEVAPDYVASILTAIGQHPDCVCFNLSQRINGGEARILRFDLNYSEDGRDAAGRYFRVNHLMPLRREIASRATFPPINYGDDQIWYKSLHLAGAIRSQIKIERPLYFYHFNVATTANQTPVARAHTMKLAESGIRVSMNSQGRLFNSLQAPLPAGSRFIGTIQIQ